MRLNLCFVLLINFLVVWFHSGLFSQGEFYGDSQKIALSIVGEDVSIFEIPPSFLIKKFVEDRISVWQEKGEYEKSSDYIERVNEINRDKKIVQYTDSAIYLLKRYYSKNIDWSNCVLNEYDADNETYLIESSILDEFAIHVPIADAPSFKSNWSNIKFINPTFYISDDKVKLGKITIKNPSNGKSYVYDCAQETIYSASNISFNFKPIEILLQENGVVLNNTSIETKNVAIGLSDVDNNIPFNYLFNESSFVLIFANENYQKEVKVQFAINDGKVFKEYCEKTLGIPSKNIHFVQDATFGNMKSELKWISDVASAYGGKAKLIVYYAGHGMPNELDKSAYLLPVDGISSDFETAIKLDDLYARLSQHPSQSVTVFLDACFSGSIRDNGMLAHARSVKIKPKNGLINGNVVVFSAATGDETAYPYIEKQHGLFTYFLLKKIQETKGDVDYQMLADYVIENVRQQSIVINQKSQTPQVNVSVDFENQWSSMKLK